MGGEQLKFLLVKKRQSENLLIVFLWILILEKLPDYWLDACNDYHSLILSKTCVMDTSFGIKQISPFHHQARLLKAILT